MNRTSFVSSAIALASLFAIGIPALADVRSIEFYRREPFAGGMEFGRVGPYEKLVGGAHFQVDPAPLRNRGIVDLALAPRNRAATIEIESGVYILRST